MDDAGQDVSRRLELTGHDDLDLQTFLDLARDPEIGVRHFLLHNHALPRSVLDVMYDENPDMRELISRHQNARTELKGVVPMVEHSMVAVEQYLSEVHASPPQRRAVMELFMTGAPVRPLEQVWQEVRSTVV